VTSPALNLLVLRCRDLNASRAFYEQLGFTFADHVHGTGPLHYAAEAPDFVLELYPAPSADSADQTGLGFAVPDLHALHQRLTTAGLYPGPIKDNPWGRTFVLRDPDHRRVEIQHAPEFPPLGSTPPPK
jgi:catechol 2,3-dioxygenase-like lactoylglutathione lyase family enzyme